MLLGIQKVRNNKHGPTRCPLQARSNANVAVLACRLSIDDRVRTGTYEHCIWLPLAEFHKKKSISKSQFYFNIHNLHVFRQVPPTKKKKNQSTRSQEAGIVMCLPTTPSVHEKWHREKERNYATHSFFIHIYIFNYGSLWIMTWYCVRTSYQMMVQLSVSSLVERGIESFFMSLSIP